MLRWLRTQDDPKPLLPEERVLLRGPSGFGRKGHQLRSGMLVVTNRRLSFNPKAPLWPFDSKRIEFDLSMIVSITPTGRKSVTDPFPLLERYSIALRNGDQFEVQTFHVEEWIKACRTGQLDEED
jgi:hypothetical protein